MSKPRISQKSANNRLGIILFGKAKKYLMGSGPQPDFLFQRIPHAVTLILQSRSFTCFFPYSFISI